MSFGDQEQPVRQFDVRRTASLLLVIPTIPFFGIVVFEAAAYWYLPSTHTGSVVFLTLFPVVWIFQAAYVIFHYKKIEFYNSHVKLFSVLGRPLDVPYSELNVRLKHDRKGRAFCVLTSKTSPRPSWRVGNIGIDHLNTTLIPWLESRVSSLS